MFRSQAFLKQLRSSNEGGDVDSFRRFLPALPEGMADDLYAGVEERIGSEEERFRRTLADIIDLMWMQYDDTHDPLAHEDWLLVRDLIDQYAIDLDMARVEYVMERVVSHRALDR